MDYIYRRLSGFVSESDDQSETDGQSGSDDEWESYDESEPDIT
jgi:hypothetical protein